MPNELRSRPILKRGPVVNTYTGTDFYPFDPRPEEVDIRDIAHALSLLCRYNGHVTTFYSVAEHCVLMSRLASPENKLAALMHDSAEAYIGDMISPIKNMMPEFVALEDKVLSAICRKFNIPNPNEPIEVRQLDSHIRNDEMIRLLSDPNPLTVGPAYTGVAIMGWEPVEAESEFLRVFNGLTSV